MTELTRGFTVGMDLGASLDGRRGYCYCGCGQETRLRSHDDRQGGYHKGDPMRFVKGHKLPSERTARGLDDLHTQARFWSKVDKQGECWLWKGRTNRHGYGVFDMPGKEGPPTLAHRVASILADGPIGEGIYVLHHCDTPGCVRPAHLYRGSQTDNMRDMHTRGRAGLGGAKGISNANAILNDELVRAIRAAYVPGATTQQKVADEFGVTRSVVCDVTRRKSWRHVS